MRKYDVESSFLRNALLSFNNELRKLAIKEARQTLYAPIFFGCFIFNNDCSFPFLLTEKRF